MRRMSMIPVFVCIFYLVSALNLYAGSRTVTDMAGRRVTVNGPVNRIVTSFKPATLCVFSLGMGHRLVGVDNSSRQDRLHLALSPAIANAGGIGTKTEGINFESLIALKPDLVVLFSQKEGHSLSDRLSAINIPSLIIFPETFESIKTSLRVIAGACGEQQGLARVEKKMDEILELAGQGIRNLPKEAVKSGYFASSLGLFSTTTANMIQHEMFTQAGIRNVSGGLSGYFQDISPEQLIRWDPQIIVLSRHLPSGEASRISGKFLSSIRAVSVKAVYRCPSDLAPWDYPSPLSVLAVLWMAQKAYPERFSGIDVKLIADDYYYSLFGKTMSEMGGTLNDQID